MVKIEYSAKYIRNISNLDARDSDNRPHTDLHYESDFGWHEERCISAHLPELFGGLFHIAFASAIEFINRIEIVHETYECDDPSEYEDDKKPVLVYLAHERIKKEREDEKIEIENTPDTERYRFSFVSVWRRIIKKSKALKKIFSSMENKK